MIPKKIHYCWFGNSELPDLAKKCIDSWRLFLPDYQIIEWNESHFDVHQIPYTSEAYQARKYAFVSDYARFKILYNHGGLYFDTDVEVIQNMDKIIEKGAFMGLEKNTSETFACAPGLGMGAPAQHPFYKDVLDMYHSLEFDPKNLKTVVEHTSELMLKQGLELKRGIIEFRGIHIYPPEYFCPKIYEKAKIKLSPNTYTIHHYAGSWMSKKQRWMNSIRYLFGDKVFEYIWRLFKK